MYKIYHQNLCTPDGYVAKLLLIMRLTIFLTLIAVINVTAAGFAQKITLSEKNAQLTQIFDQIRKQSGYDFIITKELLKQAKPVSIEVRNMELTDVLDKIFAKQSLRYILDEKSVVIKKKEPELIEKISSFFQQDSLVFKGRVLDAFGDPLPGASVKVKGTKKSTFTTKEGYFAIFAAYNAVLQVSYVGYETQQLQLRREDAGVQIKFNMKLAEQGLSEVGIVSTGYQNLPKERATGSFEIITAKQLEHSTNPNLLKRLEGITTGMDFNNPLFNTFTTGRPIQPALSGVTIRGKNTLNVGLAYGKFQSSGNILIVIDGIATPYAIDDINPNDVESINILRDAASASIWGARASNGVIVIKSKKGKFNSPTAVSFSSNLSITNELDLFYRKTMSISDYIDAQVRLYNDMYAANGDLAIEDPNLVQPQLRMSPVAEIMNEFKIGRLDSIQAFAQLDALRGNDIRRDYEKYLLRKPVTQNYSLAISGGTRNFAYRLSGGYDNILSNSVTDGSNRATLNYATTIRPLKNLELQTIVAYSQQNSHTQPSEYIVQAQLTGDGYYPYSRLADNQGNALSLYPDFRPAFLDTLAKNYGDKILDMSYKPLEEIKLNYNKFKFQGLNLNLNADYKLNDVFSVNITYSYNWGLSEQKTLNNERSYFMRQLINKFTNPEIIPDGNPEDPLNVFVPFERQIPLGGRFTYTPTKTNSQTLRGQVNIDKTWNTKHVLSAIAGMDIAQDYGVTQGTQYYGYKENGARSNVNLPFGKYLYTLYNDKDFFFSSDKIPDLTPSLSDFKIRTYSFYSNAAYTFDRRYTLSGSIRKDASSLLGNAYNSGGTPFFSFGSIWSINNEPFYKVDWLPYLQLKATFGYSGNTNARYTSSPVLNYGPPGINSLPFAYVLQGTNLQLRPEKSATLNLGIHFGLKNNRVSGNMEYYIRKTTELVSSGPLDPSTGFGSQDYNIGNLRSTGIDFSLSSLNLQTRMFSWTSNFLFSNNKVKVTKLFSARSPTASQMVSNQVLYNEGSELSRLYAWKWAGLDPQTGDPMIYLDDKALNVTVQQNSTALSQAPLSAAKLVGPSVPVYYGSFRNTFRYQNFSVSANFLYKLGYYFRNPTNELALYNRLFPNNQLLGAEYANRWQKPGDEQFTNVPSIRYSGSSSRDGFYQYADINVLKADHIRLQEINCSYTFNTKNRFIKNPRIHGYVNNLGLVWKANKRGLDPDVRDYPQPRTYSFGFSANF